MKRRPGNVDEKGDRCCGRGEGGGWTGVPSEGEEENQR